MEKSKNYLVFIQENRLIDDENMIYENEKPILIAEEYHQNWTNGSPKNAGVCQALMNYSYNSYAHSKLVCGKSAILDLIDRNENILQKMKIFKVDTVDYNIHPAKKEQLNQRGRALTWDWIVVNSKKELLNIFDSNTAKLT